MSMRVRHIRLIASNWTFHAVRGGAGLSFLLLALLFGLSVAHIIITPIELAVSQMKKQGISQDDKAAMDKVLDVARPIVRWAVGGKLLNENTDKKSQPPIGVFPLLPGKPVGDPDPPPKTEYDRWAGYLLDDRPAVLSVIFLVLIFGTPFLIPVIGFNQISGDVQSRGLRYLLTRTERGSIYTGRFLGTALFTAAVMLFVMATIVFYVAMKMRIYSTGPLILWGVYGFASMAMVSLPYIALCSCISAMIDSPFLSMVVSNLIILGIPLAAFLGGMWQDLVKYVNYLLPWGIQNYLLHPSALYAGGAFFACAGYTAFFFLLGYFHFRRRDL
jgi:ABC-type transport system involved in multi-copper enzyme maturation permease subunit